MNYAKAYAIYQELYNERSEWEQEWRQISSHLLPGRGIYTKATKPPKRKLTNPKIINTVGEDSLLVLTSGMHGGLTSPSRPWFKLEWADVGLNDYEPLKQWLQTCELRLHEGLHASNFYSIINSFYIEYGGFGTGSVYVGHDTYEDTVPFRFELLTAGEYVFSVGADGRPDQFFRVIFMSPRQFHQRFPKAASKELKKRIKKNDEGLDATDVAILEFIRKKKYQDKAYTQHYYVVQASGTGSRVVDSYDKPIATYGFYEFPYPVARWSTIGSDKYGVGPGSRALPDIKRLQEMEKAFLMATHKTINPPLNVPARMKGKTSTLPGGYNYYANPNETVNELYQVRFDFQGVSAAVERVEQRIQRNFFNDIFLTASRDPNASPLRTGQVQAQEQEKMLRLGPVIERLQHEFLQPVVERCFNIMLRKKLMPELSPELAEMAGDYSVNLVSPLATAQRMVAVQGINSFMAFVGQAAQFDPTILDNINVDEAAREYADITGVQLGVLRPQDEVDKLRKQRAEAQQAQQEKEEQMAMAGAESQFGKEQAETQKLRAEAGEIMTKTQATAIESGVQ